MPVTYKDTYFSFSNGITAFLAPSTSITVSHQGQLEESRILAANQNNNFRISGPVVTKLSTTFPICNKFAGDNTGSTSYNALSGLLANYTGTSGLDIYIGNCAFGQSYLDRLTITIVPFAPIMCSADFTCITNEWITGSTFSGTGPVGNETISNHIGYGNNVLLSGGSVLSEGNQSEMVYTLNLNRSYLTSIGAMSPSNIFLDSITKELTIKDTNIYKFVNYSGGTGDVLSITPKTASGVAILATGLLGFSNNCRIMTQNINITAGTIAVADISVKEVVF